MLRWDCYVRVAGLRLTGKMVPPTAPVMAETTKPDTKSDATTMAAPSEAAASAARAPMEYSSLMTHTKPRPIARMVAALKRIPIGFIETPPASTPTPSDAPETS